MPIGFGIVPNGPESALAGDSLADRVALALGQEVRYETYESPMALSLGFLRDEIDLLWSSPTLALTAAPLKGAVPIGASVREGQRYYHAVLFAQRDSPIKNPMELRHKRVAWVAESSASGHIFPKLALAGFGVDPSGFFGQEVFLGSHGDVVRAVASGEVDVGATYAVFQNGDAAGEVLRTGFHDVAPDEKFRILLATPRIHADLLLVRDRLAEVGPRILGAFQSVGAAHPAEVSAVLGTHEFAAVDGASLAELRVQVAHAKALNIFDVHLV